MDNFYKAQEIVKKYHQEHLLKFYDKLEEDKKNQLLEQILKTDFELLNKIYEDVNKEKSTEDLSQRSLSLRQRKEIQAVLRSAEPGAVKEILFYRKKVTRW